ncbi:MAG: 4'-phosphopantetheinyl transferase superfamily protein, partial [Hyphomicrobiales bacterium]|nr:4'-phosphopantetheinyl transferase superfamily protein [Hyphomicrobiales bacterium]
RYRRYHFDRDRDLYLAARVLLRTALSRYVSVSPADWVFSQNAFGKPEIDGSIDGDGLRFNLSHTAGLVVCAVTRSADIGVDVERLSRTVPDMQFARRHFAWSEYWSLVATPGPARARVFFAHWTVKEAYLKARGLGLSLPLDSIVIRPASDGGWSVRLEDAETESGAWHFAMREVGREHLIAVAARQPIGIEPSFVVRSDALLSDATRQSPSL